MCWLVSNLASRGYSNNKMPAPPRSVIPALWTCRLRGQPVTGLGRTRILCVWSWYRSGFSSRCDSRYRKLVLSLSIDCRIVRCDHDTLDTRSVAIRIEAYALRASLLPSYQRESHFLKTLDRFISLRAKEVRQTAINWTRNLRGLRIVGARLLSHRALWKRDPPQCREHWKLLAALALFLAETRRRSSKH